jgi:hypothetical protein
VAPRCRSGMARSTPTSRAPRKVDGSDCRTTLMVRNLAPEFSKRHLIELLNSICPGKYDFAYNRIDFRQNQSVGYGFINFINASCLLVFVKGQAAILQRLPSAHEGPQVDNDSKEAAFERDSDCRTTLMVRNFPPEFIRASSSTSRTPAVCPGKYTSE